MQCSFTFCGKDSREVGLYYAPENSSTYIFSPSEIDIDEQTYDAYNGGYYFGHSYKPKTFDLRCYYEDSLVTAGHMTQIHRFFKIGKSGKLIFSVRPWVYYWATVTKVDTSKLLNPKNGFVTITMKAYYPFGRTDETYIDEDSEYSEDMLLNSNMLTDDILPPISFTDSITSLKELPLFNGGTQKAAVKIDIAGDVDAGVTIYNRNNGNMVRFQGLKSGNPTEYVECDSISGNCYWVSTGTKNGQNAFLYHSEGFLELEPCNTIYRGLDIDTTANSSTITTTNSEFTNDMVGLYIYADGEFRGIRAVGNDGKSMTVMPACSNTVHSDDATVAEMNHIVVSPDSPGGTMELTYLGFKYAQTFS